MPPSYSNVLYLDHSICCHGRAQIRASGNNKQACIRAADCRLGRSIDAPDEMLKRGHHRFPLSGEKKERKMQGHPDVCLPCRPELPSLGPSFANVRFRESEGSQMSVSKLVPAPRVRDEPARPWAFFPFPGVLLAGRLNPRLRKLSGDGRRACRKTVYLGEQP